MKVSAQYAQEHFDELLETADRGEDLETARDGKPSYKLFVVAPQAGRMEGKRILGTGAGELALPTDAEWKAMDKELEDIMVNGPLFPADKL